MSFRTNIRLQRGDTLIEVTFALSILAFVLLGATAVASRSFLQGQNAGERTSLADEAQQNLEAVRGFRDDHSWTEFLNGKTPTFKGVLNGRSASGCKATSPCMHMALNAVGSVPREYLPVGGSTAGSVPTSYIEIAVEPEAGPTPQYVDLTVSYGFDTRGGGAESEGHIKTRLTDLQYASVLAEEAAEAPPAAQPSLPGDPDAPDVSPAGCTKGPDGTCAPATGPAKYRWTQFIVNTSTYLSAPIQSCVWQFSNGVRKTNNCEIGDVQNIKWDEPASFKKKVYPDGCYSIPGSVILTLTLANGNTPSKTYNMNYPSCY